MTTNTESARLAACPFCEGHAIEDYETDADYPSKRFMFIRCCRCGVKTSAIYGSSDPSEWADARHNWNRRADTLLAASRAEVERLRAALNSVSRQVAGMGAGLAEAKRQVDTALHQTTES